MHTAELEQQSMPFPTMAELYLEEMQNNPPKPENIYSYKSQYDNGGVHQAIAIGPQHFPHPAIIRRHLKDQTEVTILLHYPKMVGYGDIIGYSVLTKNLSYKEIKLLDRQVKDAKIKPADVQNFIPEGHPILFTVEN